MPLAADRLLFPAGLEGDTRGLKIRSGVSTALEQCLVAATIVGSVIAGEVGVVCADAESARAVASERNALSPMSLFAR